MKANFALRVVAISATLAVLMFTSRCQAQYRTPNFVVYAQQPVLAKQVGDLAEKYRRELAELWLGSELPAWPAPCPITVEVGRHAGGETSFAFSPRPNGKSQPFDWRMKIYGPPERILDSVLPHEVTHTIFATHYGRPLPRWADEGACTTVEHEIERKKNHQMLMEFLTSNRGIPFNHMFAMKKYPRDILPLYAQGYSVAKYLIMQRGHRHFVNFVGEGMQRETPGRESQTWNDVTRKYYEIDNLSDLQVRWLGWVKKGSPGLSRVDVAANGPTVESAPGVVTGPSATIALASHASTPQGGETESWYVQQSRTGGNATMQRPSNGIERSRSMPGYTPGSIEVVVSPPNQSPDLSGKIWR